MSETNFTPGPWTLATSCSWRRIIGPEDEPVVMPTIQRSDNHPDLSIREADANLILAAPEMYEALVPFANFACDLEKGEICDCFNCKAREALAKARGETA